MKVKTFVGWSENNLDQKVNGFLEDSTLEIVDIKFAIHFFFFSAMVLYKSTAYSKDLSN